MGNAQIEVTLTLLGLPLPRRGKGSCLVTEECPSRAVTASASTISEAPAIQVWNLDGKPTGRCLLPGSTAEQSRRQACQHKIWCRGRQRWSCLPACSTPLAHSLLCNLLLCSTNLLPRHSNHPLLTRSDSDRNDWSSRNLGRSQDQSNPCTPLSNPFPGVLAPLS